MADWFAELVDEACAQVLARQEIRENLADVDDDRDTVDKITGMTGEALGSGQLLELHAASANAVTRLDGEREMMLRELLPRQSRAIADAENKIRRLDRQRQPAAARTETGWRGSRESSAPPRPTSRRHGRPSPRPPRRMASSGMR
ncbi:hypothetical protein EAS64_37690 [Trebonia kvetii]|uniref:Uncharacterized protein n=1 Tax=Trebonia kvetii TaxID=2480626 RepID=A0A6P2BPE8_9ACTN|nr:hypothetical protein [Trebonia kvetii]TVZ00371.1 hypothetical protein EAS64_37690 [Trebonia kvetii]